MLVEPIPQSFNRCYNHYFYIAHWIATVISIIAVALLMTFGIHDIVRYYCETSDWFTLFRGIALILFALLTMFGISRDND